IGKVFSRFAACEPWARPSKALAEVALLTPENPLYEHKIPESIFGAVQLLEELAIQFDILDASMALDGYRLVILPDDFEADAAFAEKLEQYVQAGGRVLACHRGGMNGKGEYPDCFRAKCLGDAQAYPDFVIAEGPLAKGLEPENEYVLYMQGVQLASAGA
ncbi:MAG TPA: beta-galactosidase trimerization domain-containing protein, partial [Clostridia bacterium]|nr:beta-galactosidase trimerization domain-containing protein [Clostridia bacterium]